MRILKKLKKIILGTPKMLDRHSAIKFNSIDEFMKFVKGCDYFDNNYLYYYQGSAEQLYDVICSEYSNGEYTIQSESINYLDIKLFDDKGKITLFDTAMFFSDIVKELKGKTDIDWSLVYNPCNGHARKFSKAIITKDSVYFCSK